MPTPLARYAGSVAQWKRRQRPRYGALPVDCDTLSDRADSLALVISDPFGRGATEGLQRRPGASQTLTRHGALGVNGALDAKNTGPALQGELEQDYGPSTRLLMKHIVRVRHSSGGGGDFYGFEADVAHAGLLAPA